MNILIDIMHPAHVHFFKHTIRELQRMHHKVVVTSRDKDVTLNLLEAEGIQHHVISKEAKGMAGMGLELIGRNLRMLKIAVANRIEVFASVGGISTAQVGRLLGRRNIIFYDTEIAHLQNKLSYPFATEIVTPEVYPGKVDPKKHLTYPGYHDMAYLHPDRFTPSKRELASAGVRYYKPYSVVRFISGQALHDRNMCRLSADGVVRIMKALEARGDVYLSTEGEEVPYQKGFNPAISHSLLAFADIYVGEGATMASEAGIMGTPSIYIDPVGRAVQTKLEQDGRMVRIHPFSIDTILHAIDLLYGMRVAPMEMLDVTEIIVDRILAKTIARTKKRTLVKGPRRLQLTSVS